MSLNILAVDDSRTMRDMVRLALGAAGMTVTTADDGVHGLEVLEGMEPDAIISDINMPRLDGFGFIRAVRAIDRARNADASPARADFDVDADLRTGAILVVNGYVLFAVTWMDARRPR